MNPRFALGHAQILKSLRRNAAAYLREIAAHFPGESNRALSDAASSYEEEVEIVSKLAEICIQAKDNKGFTASMLQEAVGAVNAALDADRKAIGKIEAALAALP